MSALIDPARSNGPLNVLIAGSAPGTPGDPGVGISEFALSNDGTALIVSLTDGRQEIVPLAALLDLVSAQSSEAVADAAQKYADQLSKKLDVSDVYQDQTGVLRLVPSVVGTLPADIVLNGQIYMAGATALPAGLYLNSDGVTVMTDGTVYFPNTVNNNGVLCAAGA